jgi:exodeoxyribonuclease V alpha subunit
LRYAIGGYYKKRIPKKFNYNPLNDIQVLTPMNRGIVGTLKLNEALQDALNPSGFEITRGGRRYRTGDKVMQIKNNYDKNVFNGDIGTISSIDSENQTVTVNIDGNEINYDYADLDELVLAYAISIHKSQGSEYPAVVIPLVMAHYVMLQRNLLYTAITRGKKLVIVIGSKKALFLAVNNNKTIKRNTWLCHRLTRN